MIVEERNSIPQILEEFEKLKMMKIEIGIFGADDSYLSMVASVNEFGANIKPKNGKFLTIPTKHAKGRKASEIEGLYRPFGKNREPINLLVVNGGPEQNEYGNTVMFYLSKGVTIPERSFIRSTFDEKVDEWIIYLKSLISNMIKGKYDAQIVAERLGLRIQRDIQKVIRDKSRPSNSEATIARKGSDNPLIDSGRLRQSVTFKVG